MPIPLLVPAGIAAAGSLLSGIMGMEAADARAAESQRQAFAAISEGAMNRELRNLDAQNVKKEAASQVEQIRRAALLARAQIVTATSGSGVMIGEGSAQAAVDQLQTMASADALAALYSGSNKAASIRQSARMGMEASREAARAKQAEASSYQAAGQAAMIGSIFSAGTSLLGGMK